MQEEDQTDDGRDEEDGESADGDDHDDRGTDGGRDDLGWINPVLKPWICVGGTFDCTWVGFLYTCLLISTQFHVRESNEHEAEDDDEARESWEREKRRGEGEKLR